MKLKKIASLTGCALVALTAATFALPRHVSVARTATFDADAQAVLALAASNQGYQEFNPYKNSDPALKIDLFGPVSGVGSGFHFDSKDGKGSQTVTEVTPEKVTYAVDLGPLGQPTQSITVMPTDAGTEVTWRVESDMGFNSAFRVFGLFMNGVMGPVFEQGLENLAEVAA